MTTSDQTSPRERLDRTTCDCDKCRLACCTMPGYLIPGDAEAIAEHLGADPTDEQWMAEHFAASEGATVGQHTPHGMVLYNIPTIVPRQQVRGGACVFYDGEHCTVHQVAPFGCAFMSVCESNPEDGRTASEVGLRAIARSEEYQHQHQRLYELGSIAHPRERRKAAFQAGIKAIEHEESGARRGPKKKS